jgi:hypothetical protein
VPAGPPATAGFAFSRAAFDVARLTHARLHACQLTAVGQQPSASGRRIGDLVATRARLNDYVLPYVV